jgi:uncharacterized protein (TIGR02145 family)
MYRVFIFFVLLFFSCSFSENNGTFVDQRDGNEYAWVRVADQIWMAENLAYLPKVHRIEDNSIVEPRYYVYGNAHESVDEARKHQIQPDIGDDSILVHKEFGVLYNWAAVTNGHQLDKNDKLQGVCPVGWHVPSDEEWMLLEKSLGMEELDLPAIGLRSSGDVSDFIKSESLWENGGNGKDSIGLGFKPSGQAYSGTAYIDLNKKAIFWSSTKDINNNIWTREVNCCDDGVIRRSKYIEDGFAVRCVRD